MRLPSRWAPEIRGQGMGVILFDYDNDGDLDIFITNNHEHIVDGATPVRSPGAPALLRNDTPTENHWLKVTLEGTPPLHRDGIGSRVYVTTNGVTQMRELHASTNYVTQEPGRIAHFGLGAATCNRRGPRRVGEWRHRRNDPRTGRSAHLHFESLGLVS